MADLEKTLEPCPFCKTEENGDGRIRMSIAESSEGYFAVVCWCGGSGPIMDSKREAIEAWNSRGPSDPNQVRDPFDSSKCKDSVGFKGNKSHWLFQQSCSFYLLITGPGCCILVRARR